MVKTTPLESLHLQLGAEFIEYYGWMMPGSFSGIENELAGLAATSAAFDLSPFSRISLSGSDSDKVITAAFPSLNPVCVDCWEWANGDKNVRVAKTSNEYLIISHPGVSQSVYETLAEKARNSSANLSDRTDKTAMIGIYGPSSYPTLSRIVPLDISGISEQGSVLTVSLFMMSFTVIRGSWLGGEGVELICPNSAAKFATQAIEKYHKRENIVPAGVSCFDAAFEKYVFETKMQ